LLGREKTQENGCRRGSSTVSAGTAERPVTDGDVAGGIRRANDYRMIWRSHINSVLVGFGQRVRGVSPPLARASHRMERWLPARL